MPSVRVMTLNVWSGLTYRGVLRMGYFEPDQARARRFDGLIEEILRLKPDIIGINEANPLPSYIHDLSRRTGYDCIWHMGVSGLRIGNTGIPTNLREGDAILARKGLDLKFVGQTKLAGPGIVRRSFSVHTGDLTQAILGCITVEGSRVFICVTHWHATIGGERAIGLAEEIKRAYGYSDHDYRKVLRTIENDRRWKMKEAEATVRWLKDKVPSGEPLMLMGDLNAEPDRPEISFLRSNGFREAQPEGGKYTWDPMTNTNLISYYPKNLQTRFDCIYDHLRAIYEKTNRRRIDYIIVNDSAEILDTGICADSPFIGSHISDHYGVFADIALR